MVGALFAGLGVHVGDSPAELVGGGVGVPVVFGATLHITLESSHRGHVARGVGYYDISVAAYNSPHARYASAGAQRCRQGRIEELVVAVVAVVAAVGCSTFFFDVDVVAAVNIVGSGVDVADLVVPDEGLRHGIADHLVVVVNVCMERESVFAGAEVGHMGVEVGVGGQVGVVVIGPYGVVDLHVVGRRYPLALPCDAVYVAVRTKICRA